MLDAETLARMQAYVAAHQADPDLAISPDDPILDRMAEWIETLRIAEKDPEWLPSAFTFGVKPTQQLRDALGLAEDAPLPERVLGVPMEYTDDPEAIAIQLVHFDTWREYQAWSAEQRRKEADLE